MSRRRAGLAVAALLAGALGCTQAPPKPDSVDRFVAERVQLARSLEYQGDLRGALEQWRIVHTVSPSDENAAGKVHTLAALTKQRSEAARRDAAALLKAGDPKAARGRLLASLVFDPDDEATLGRLREIELATLRRRQAVRLRRYGDRQVERAMHASTLAEGKDRQLARVFREAVALFERGELKRAESALEDYLAARPRDEKARRYAAQVQHMLAGAHGKNGEYREALQRLEASRDYDDSAALKLEEEIRLVRGKLAEQLYSQGVRISGENLQRAIDYWQMALTYDQGHARARLRLREAQAAPNQVPPN